MSTIDSRAKLAGVILIAGLILADIRAEVAAWNTPDTELRADRETGRVEVLGHRPNGASWATSPFSIIRTTGASRLRTELDARPTAEGILLHCS